MAIINGKLTIHVTGYDVTARINIKMQILKTTIHGDSNWGLKNYKSTTITTGPQLRIFKFANFSNLFILFF